jgi:hypothetical protein
MKKIFIIILFLFFTSTIQAAPVLYFSDITSGPKTGLTDDQVTNQGAIVTIWGAGLGSSQGDSTISACGAAPSHIYTWANASIQKGHPADLYTYHKMQYIQFAISSSANDGAGTISVTVGGETSNTLPFTIRSGNIYFVATTGDNGDTGTWAEPWADMRYATDHNAAGTSLANNTWVIYADYN